MTSPFPVPAEGSRPKLYRLLRDTLYFPAGTVLCLMPEQVLEYHHEPISVPSDDAGLIADLAARVTRLENR